MELTVACQNAKVTVAASTLPIMETIGNVWALPTVKSYLQTHVTTVIQEIGSVKVCNTLICSFNPLQVFITL